MRILINDISATAGGGVTTTRNYLNQLQNIGGKHEFVVFIPASQEMEYQKYAGDIHLETSHFASKSFAHRLLWEQYELRRFIKQMNIDVLIANNFGLINPPCKQILRNRNALYFSEHFEADLRRRKQYRHLMENRLRRALALASMRSSDVNIVLTNASGRSIPDRYHSVRHLQFKTVPYGFDIEFFTQCQEPLSEQTRNQLKWGETYKRILLVSHYNYFRNFETLIKAIPFLKEQLSERVMIVLTTKIEAGMIHGGYDSTYAAHLIDALGVRSDIAMLGTVPYEQIHRLYKCCDIVVCPSYAETLGYPKAEAMAAERPIVAADLPVHQEVCQDAAVYFDVFDEHALAERCVQVLRDTELYRKLQANAAKQRQQFSWEKQVQALLQIAENIVS
jgi:glycosyltransferase involved in cell wall biosynthesis